MVRLKLPLLLVGKLYNDEILRLIYALQLGSCNTIKKQYFTITCVNSTIRHKNPCVTLCESFVSQLRTIRTVQRLIEKWPRSAFGWFSVIQYGWENIMYPCGLPLSSSCQNRRYRKPFLAFFTWQVNLPPSPLSPGKRSNRDISLS